MAAKLTRLTHEIAIQLHLVAESCTRSRRPVRKLLDALSFTNLKVNSMKDSVCQGKFMRTVDPASRLCSMNANKLSQRMFLCCDERSPPCF
jgi:hypothetical protein